MTISFPLKLHIWVNDYNTGILATPHLTDELKDWLGKTNITRYALCWRLVDPTHPHYNKFPVKFRNDDPNRRGHLVDTWIIFQKQSDAALFKLTWGNYEGS